jgi:hypothetical protein
VLKPKAYLPVHWDGLFGPFQSGVTAPFADSTVETQLARAGVTLVRPRQYMDRWRLDRDGMHSVQNDSVKNAIGIPTLP